MRCYIISLLILFPTFATQAQNTGATPRVFGILPNYRTVPDASGQAPPLTTAAKFRLATRDSFDWSTLLVAGYFAGMAQVTDHYPAWGQGGKGFAKRYAASYADQAIGNYLSEGIFPSIFHQDPRYFRLAKGSALQRIGYAISRIAITRNDSGGAMFNYSEFAGNAAAAGIGSLYYPAENRTASDIRQKFVLQVGTDAGFNVLKEFWPDIYRKIWKKQ